MPSAQGTRQKVKSKPSVLSALGISVRALDSGSLKVVASDRRIQTTNERLANPSRQTVSRTSQSDLRDVVDLHKACRQGNVTDIEFLLSQDSSLVNRESLASEDYLGVGGTALHYATLGNHPHIVSLILMRGGVAEAESHRGVTPLQIACARGFVECAEVLLQSGASLLKRNRQGVTPMATLRQDCGVPELRKQREVILSRQKSTRTELPVNQALLRIADKTMNRHR